MSRKQSRFQFIHALFALLLLPLAARAGTYINFDYPAAYYTAVGAINNSGDAAGVWSTGLPNGNYGFFRQANGTLYSIQPSRAIRVVVTGIHNPGKVLGYYLDSNSIAHGFIRNLAGELTTLNAPGAGYDRNSTGTFPSSINDSGEVAGYYVDERQVSHGFIRDAAGNYTSFDPPGSVYLPSAFINSTGEIAGVYWTSASPENIYGYVRNSSGNITTFSAPGADYGTFVGGINASGEVAGTYIYETGEYAYTRDAQGNFSTYELEGSDGEVVGVQDSGDVIGEEFTYSSPNYGFRLNSVGVLTSFSDPSASTDPGTGTVPLTISANGNIGGCYATYGFLYHGFIWLPK